MAQCLLLLERHLQSVHWSTVGVHLVRADHDLVQRTVVLRIAVVGALRTVHSMHLLALVMQKLMVFSSFLKSKSIMSKAASYQNSLKPRFYLFCYGLLSNFMLSYIAAPFSYHR